MPSATSKSRAIRASEASTRFSVGGRPIELAIALLIVAGFGVTGAVATILLAAGVPVFGYPANETGSLGGAIFVALTAALVMFGMCFLTWRGANWARILIVILTTLSLLLEAYRTITDGLDVPSIATAPLAVAIVVLLVLPRVNAWMRAQA